jgi:DNA-binding response OmpR family regulator
MYALLLAEEPHEAAILSLVLQRSGLAVTMAKDLEHALEIWMERPADLVLVSLASPSLVEQVRQVRAQIKVPLVLVCNPIEEQLHLDLLEAGVDMVVIRPFSARLLIAQMRALLRRAGGTSVINLPTLSASGLRLDPAARMVEVEDRPPRRLTHLEFRLFYILMINRGQVLPIDKIVEWVWGYNGQGDRELVRGLISRLRSKIETNPQKPSYILTVPGVGYLFSADD